MTDRQATNPWAVLAVLCGGIFMLLLDTTVVNVAQRAIQENLKADLSQIQWILDSYILTYGVLLLAFGRLGDIFGRKKLFLIGLAIFTIASGLCGASAAIADLTPLSGPSSLIAFRVLQGFGGAMMMPQSLSLITVAFPPEKRGAALGVWAGVIGFATVVGPILGGYIVTDYAWEWVFLVNIPVGALLLPLAMRLLPESTDPQASRRVDWIGVGLSGLALFALVFGLIEAPHAGWASARTILTMIAAVALFSVFIVWERRQVDAIVKLELFRSRNFSIAILLTGISAFGLFGIFFPMTIFLQAALGFTPVRSGSTLIPMSAMTMITAPIVGRLLQRIHPRWFMTVGFSLVSLGILLIFDATDRGADWHTLFFPAAVTGLGMGMTFAPMTTVAMKEVPPRIAGSASGIINTTRSIGQVLGIAVLGSVLQSRTAANVEDRLQPFALPGEVTTSIAAFAKDLRLAEMFGAIRQAAPDRFDDLFIAWQLAMIDAVRSTFLVSVVVCACCVPLALSLRSREARVPDPASPKRDRVAYPAGE